VFGKYLSVELSDNIVDGIDVHNSHDIYQSKNVAYCSVGRYSESIYGVNNFQTTRNSMRCHICFVKGAQRCFETYLTGGISDSYFTLNCTGCSDVMFSFNLRNRSHCIGNLQLTRERYMELKKKLISEMAEKLRKDKRLFSLPDMMKGAANTEEERGKISPETEKALAETLKVVLQKEHRDCARLASWLGKKAVKVRKTTGAGGKSVLKYETPTLKGIAAAKLAPLEMALQSASSSIKIAEGSMPSLEEIAKRASEIGLATLEMIEGNNLSVRQTPVKYGSTDNEWLWFSLHSKHSGLSSIVTDSDHIFGGYIRILECQFCVNCFNITKCSGCLECDSCFSCRNCYFCHNCENVEEGILCFNLKGARYAILNQSVSKEEYMRVKKMLLEYVNSELEKKGALERGIFSLSQPEAKKSAIPAKRVT
jgi:predicted metal-binding transcription factor (methanogenesis marker protein 9)